MGKYERFWCYVCYCASVRLSDQRMEPVLKMQKLLQQRQVFNGVKKDIQMKKIIKLTAGFYFLMLALCTWSQDNSGFVYFNDFETSADSEWSKNKIEQAPSGESFLGHFGNDNLTLSIADLATHERIKISFDLTL